ncbi:MAG: RidA family protein [Acidimicrobiia bacterium]|nr:RidA family protein [Acidimicrobiia bacterium]MDH5519658.1 RidA family protein [Acidimicrobiia bacterium]
MNDAELAAGLPPTPGYRYAERVGSQLFVAGQVPHDRSGSIVAVGDPAAQASACLDNLAIVLDVNGFEESDVRRLSVYVVGEEEDLAGAWSGVVGWFGGTVPPATLLGVARLGYSDQLVEIDAIVVRTTAHQIGS